MNSRLTLLQPLFKRCEKAYWAARCECGERTVVQLTNFRSGHTKSCGCLQKERAAETHRRHGHNRKRAETGTYRSWRSMIGRCNNPRDSGWKYYGKLGVSVCAAWQDFPNFLRDMGVRPEGCTLDRINPFGNYEPSNCRWADIITQANNKRNNYVIKYPSAKEQPNRKARKSSRKRIFAENQSAAAVARKSRYEKRHSGNAAN